MKVYSVVFFMLFFVTFGYPNENNYKEDSIRITSLFNTLLKAPDKKDSILQQVNDIVERNKEVEYTYYLNLSKYLFRTGNLDSVLKIVDSVLQRIPVSDELVRAKFYNIKGAVFSYKKDYEKAIELFKKTVELYERNNEKYQAALVKNNIANIFFGLNNFEYVYKYSYASYKVLQEQKDTLYLPQITAIMGLAKLNLKQEKEAEKWANQSLQQSERYNNLVGKIIAYYTLGELALTRKEYTASDSLFQKSLTLSKIAHLQQYILLNNVGPLILNKEIKNYKVAEQYGLEALYISKSIKNENIQYAIYKHLAEVYNGLLQHEKAFSYMQKAHDLYKQTAGIEQQKHIDELLAKYETEKIQRELSNKKLILAQKDLKIQKKQKQFYTLILLLGIVFMLLLFYIKYSKDKARKTALKKGLEQTIAVAKAEEKEKERISEQLHNGVASSLTFVKLQLENALKQKDLTLVQTLPQDIEKVSQEARKISHNLSALKLSNTTLDKVIEQFCVENSNDLFRIIFFNNTKQSQALELEERQAAFIYRIVQELINNSAKHAQVQECIVQYSYDSENSKLVISVEDEGVGMDKEALENSTLQELMQRAQKMGVKITVETDRNKGFLAILEHKV